MNIKKFLTSSNVSSCVLSTSGCHVNENFYYACGLSKTTRVTATALLTKKGFIILTNKLEQELFKGRKIIVENKKDVEKAFKKYASSPVGVDMAYITAGRLQKVKDYLKGKKIKDVSNSLQNSREIKTNSEIKKIKEACNVAETTLDSLDKIIKKCRTEIDLAIELEYNARRNGAEGVSFPPIVAFAENSAVPHHVPGKTKISRGILLVDFGVVYGGYCSDLTRMFHVGKANQKAIHVYKNVLRAQRAALNEVKSGRCAKHIHIASDTILKNELNQSLIHSIGHGLGIEVHDYPDGIGSTSQLLLKNNMVITVEPGYYEKNWGGIRIEDDVLVKKHAVMLSRAPSTIPEI